MNQKFTRSNSFFHRGVARSVKPTLLTAVACIFGALPNLHSADVTQTAADTLGQSSFNSSIHWSNAAAPSAGNDYITNVLLRTPSTSGNYAFGGDSLTLNSGGILSLLSGANSIITVNNLHLNGGFVNSNKNSYTVAGSIILDSNTAQFNSGGTTGNPATNTTTISASISGTSALSFSGLTTGGWTITSANNSYSGGTTFNLGVSGTAPLLDIQADGALGTGNVVLGGFAQIKFGLGTTNDYIANTASLSLTANNSINLAFVGTDYITSLIYDGTTYDLVGTTFGAIGSGATFEFSNFTGTGYLAVIPEPSVMAFLVLGGGFAIGLRRSRNRR